jgi:heme exporter protein D
LYFYIWLAISASTFLLLILWLIIWSVKDRRKNSDKEEDETN